MSVGPLLEGRDICICAGAGGVGKTTTSAAIAVGMAQQGLKVAVLTIDPARRLANSLGLPELGQRGAPDRAGRAGRAVGDDARREEHLRRDRRQARAGRRHARRGALQPDLQGALDRGRRLAGVHGDGEAPRASRRRGATTCSCWTRRPRATRSTSSTRRTGCRASSTRARSSSSSRRRAPGLKIFSRGTGLLLSVLKRLTGVDFLKDLSDFFASFGDMAEGFRDRVEGRQGAAGRRPHDLPARHLTGARGDRGGEVLPRQARRERHAVRRRRGEPDARRGGRRRPGRARRPRSRRSSRSWSRTSRTSTHCRCATARTWPS